MATYKIPLHKNTPFPGEDEKSFGYRRIYQGFRNMCSFRPEHYEWCKQRGVPYPEVTISYAKDEDEYAIFEREEDALAFKIKFGL